MIPEITVKKSKICAKTTFDKNQINLFKMLGGKWSAKEKLWQFDDTCLNHMCLARIFGWENYNPPIPWSNNQQFYQAPAYLMKHQAEAIEIARQFPRFAFFDDTGVGKTLESIEIATMHRVKTLVLAPWATIEDAWLGDIAKFRPELKAINLWDLKRKRTQKSSTYEYDLKNCEIAILNHEAVQGLFKDLVMAGFRMVIVDESSKLKSHKAKRTKLITDLCSTVPYCYLLSGTPAPNSFMEYFTQIAIVDPLLWGTKFYKWRTEYFVPFGFQNKQYRIKKYLEPKLIEDLRTVSRAVTKEDVLDLPPRTENIYRVELNTTEKQAYREMKQRLYVNLLDKNGNLKAGISGANAAVAVMKLRQITSGFIIDTENGQWHQIGDSKINALGDLLDTIGNHQLHIWTQFRPEPIMIGELLKKRGASFAVCNGTVSAKDKRSAITGYKAGDFQYLLAHPRTLGHGVTLNNAAYSIYFSVSHSYEEDKQSKDRNFRKGQDKAVSLYWMIADNSIDGIIMNCLRTKKHVQDDVLNHLKRR